MNTGSARGCLTALAALAAAAIAPFPRAADVELAPSQAWYRLEVIVFERAPDAADPGIARQRLLSPLAFPRMTAALADTRPEPDIAGAQALTISNFAPPAWYAGECVLPDWSPPPNWSDLPGPVPRDPCLPVLETNAQSTPAQPNAEEAGGAEEAGNAEDASAAHRPLPESPLRIARQRLAEALAEHERALAQTSYIWRSEMPNLAAALRRLRARFNVLAAGSWHQPVPPQDAPVHLLVQAGEAAGNDRFALEGWFGISMGHYIHFDAQLLKRLDAGYALLSETRPMRSGETHYLDHPALGILVQAQRLPVPTELAAVCPAEISCAVTAHRRR